MTDEQLAIMKRLRICPQSWISGFRAEERPHVKELVDQGLLENSEPRVRLSGSVQLVRLTQAGREALAEVGFPV